MIIKFKWPEFVSDSHKRISEANLTIKREERVKVNNILYQVNELSIQADQLRLELVSVNKSDGWTYILKKYNSDGYKPIDITDIIESSNIIPAKGDIILIEGKKWKIGHSTYYPDEQIVEWAVFDPENTKL